MVTAETVGVKSTIPVSDSIIEKIIDTVADPFLITALVVVVLMFWLLRAKEKTFDTSLREVFTELRDMSQILTETVTTNKVLTDIIVRLKKENGKDH